MFFVMFWGEVSKRKKKTPRKSHLANGEIMGHRPMFDEFGPHPRCSCDVGKNVTNGTSNVASAEMVLKEAEAQADEKRRWKLELALAMSIIETIASDTGTGTVVVILRLAKTKTKTKKTCSS